MASKVIINGCIANIKSGIHRSGKWNIIYEYYCMQHEFINLDCVLIFYSNRQYNAFNMNVK